MTMLNVLLASLLGCTPAQDWPVVEDVAVGDGYACGLVVPGDLACWGSRGGTVTVPDFRGPYLSVAAANDYSCGILRDFTLTCWGEGEMPSGAPDGEFSAVSTGPWGACAIDTDGHAHCWPSEYAHDVPANVEFTSFEAGGYGACGLKFDGAIECYCLEGHDCGVSDPPGGTYSFLTVGDDHACALDSAGVATCWGGVGYEIYPPEGALFVSIAAGEQYTCGITPETEVLCWASFGYTFSDLPSDAYDFQSSAQILRYPPPAGDYLEVAASYASGALRTRDDVVIFGEEMPGSLHEKLTEIYSE